MNTDNEEPTTLKEVINNMFLSTLEALKDCEPDSPEWVLYWEMLQAHKGYAEESTRALARQHQERT